MKIFTFGTAFHFFVAGNRRHFIFGMWFEHSKSQPTDDKLALKWAWPRHVTHFKFVVPPKISLERLKLQTSNWCACWSQQAQPSDDKLFLKGAWSLSRDLFNFWKISDNISKMVRDSLIVSIKFELEVVCALLNGYVAEDLGWHLSKLNHLNFYILHCLMHLRNWRSQRLQIWCWCKGRMCCASHSLQPTQTDPGYGHVTVLKFCRFSWCSASSGFVSDSWATCWGKRGVKLDQLIPMAFDKMSWTLHLCSRPIKDISNCKN